MKTLHPALADDLALRHAMGLQWSEARTLLPPFVDVLDQHGPPFIATDWAGCGATQPRQVQPADWARRLRWVRGLARDHSAIDPRTEIPPTDLLPYRPQRRVPSLYSDAEMAPLLEAASCLPSATGLRAHTSTAVFGRRVVTGMRISARVGLDNADVALAGGGLTIRHRTFRKSRGLPLHLTTQQALGRSVAQRNRVYPIPPSPSCFVSEQGRR
jgi:integrase/recombinase XerD